MSGILLTAIISLALSIGAICFLGYRLLTERKTIADAEALLESKAAVALNPVLQEAIILRTSIRPLLTEVDNLRRVLAEGRIKNEKDRIEYQARIDRLEALLAKVEPKNISS